MHDQLDARNRDWVWVWMWGWRGNQAGLAAQAQREAGRVRAKKAGSRELVEKSECHTRVVGLSSADSEEPLAFCAGRR